MKIHSIFLSIDGEVNAWGQGTPSLFIRTQGCLLHCSYCDVPEAQSLDGGADWEIQGLVDKILEVGCHKITITGGEPLLQEDEIHQLLNRLFPYGIRTSIETNGSISTARFREVGKPNDRISLVVDYKLDNCDKMNSRAFANLILIDWVKFVIGDRDQFEQAVRVMALLIQQGCRARFAFSTIHEELPGKTLAEWILEAKLWDVTLNCQIHKFLEFA